MANQVGTRLDVLNNGVLEEHFGETASYNYDTAATPLVIGDSAGATPALTINAETLSGSMRAIDLDGVFKYTDNGQRSVSGVPYEINESVTGNITEVGNSKQSGMSGVTVSPVINLLNVEVQTKPRPYASGTQQTYLAAFRYWCGLAGVPSGQVAVPTGGNDPVPIYPGFRGNLWEHIKMFCAAHQISVRLNGDIITFDRAPTWKAGFYDAVDLNETAAFNDRAQAIDVQYYNYVAVGNGVMFAADQVYEIGAGETQVFTQQIQATPETVNQPVCVSGISPYPYKTGFGQYVVTGSDGYIVAPTWWVDMGGSIRVAISPDNPDEIIVTIVAPNQPSRAPYRISEGGAGRPALYITGNGVTYNVQTTRCLTGDSTASQASIPVDNKFIIDQQHAFTRGVGVASTYGGPRQSVTGTLATRDIWVDAEGASGPRFSKLAGSVIKLENSNYRIDQATFGFDGVTISGSRFVTFDDFNAVWAGKTFDDFNAAYAGMSFNQAAVDPLVGP